MVEPMFDSIVLYGNVFQWQSEGYFFIKRMLIIDTDWSSTKKDRDKPNAIITTMISKLFYILSLFSRFVNVYFLMKIARKIKQV